MESELIELALRLENKSVSKSIIERVLFWSEELGKNPNMTLADALELINKKQ